MSKYYQASGKFSLSSFIYFILTSAIVLPILALIYTYLVWYIPFIYINFFITIGFGFIVATAISLITIKKGKVRNSMLALVFGALGSVVALYFSWVIWVDLVINAGESYGNSRLGITTSNIKFFQVLELAFNPGVLFELISEINGIGTWGLRGATVSGTFLTVIWGIEFLIVLVISMFVTYITAKSPFCEIDNKWFEEKELPAFNFIEKPEEMKANLESSNQNSFDELQPISDIKTESHSIFTLYFSKKGKNFLTIENKQAKVNDKNETEFDNNEFIEYISISSELKNKLLQGNSNE